jgi:hypothetical protein
MIDISLGSKAMAATARTSLLGVPQATLMASRIRLLLVVLPTSGTTTRWPTGLSMARRTLLLI